MIATPKEKRMLFWLGRALPVPALAGMTWLVHKSDGRFNNSFNWVMQNQKVLDLFEQTQSYVVDAEANERGYLLTEHRAGDRPLRSAQE